MAAIYKKGQGYWTRLMSAIAFGTLILMGAVWVWNIAPEFIPIQDVQPVFIRATCAVLFVGAFGALLYLLIGRKPNVVDFMIATEGEMKKVNWSSRREILGSTWIVIAFTVLIAVLCFVFDLLFQKFSMMIGVLESTT